MDDIAVIVRYPSHLSMICNLKGGFIHDSISLTYGKATGLDTFFNSYDLARSISCRPVSSLQVGG